MSIRDQIPDDIKRASKVIGFAAWLNDTETWLKVTFIIGCRLTLAQRKNLACAVLYTLSDDDVEHVLDTVFPPDEREAKAA